MLNKSEKSGTFTFLWAAFHVVLLVLFTTSLFFYKGFHFDADLFNMMPSPLSKAASIADKKLNGESARNVFILVGSRSFETAKNAAFTAYSELQELDGKFDSIEFYSSQNTLSDITDFIHKWRFNLLDEKTQNLLLEKNTQKDFADNALAKAASAFSFSGMEHIQEDPFLFDEEILLNYEKTVEKSGTSMQPKDGVLASKYEDVWYVMISAVLSKEGAALGSSKNAVPEIYRTCLKHENDDVRFVFSGVPFHSYKSSSSATKEISVIGTLSLFTVIIILLFVFRSPLPVFASVFSMLISISAAVCAGYVFFGKVHALTLVFGTSLIGSCIDYSLHYFINWKHSVQLDTGFKIRKSLFKGLFLSLLSTEICYASLLFAPFPLLKQMAVFSVAGILSSYLTVNGFFIFIKLPSKEKRRIPLVEKFSIKLFKNKYGSVIFKCTLFVLCGIFIIVNYSKLKIENNISNLYKMEGRLKEDTILSYKVLNYSPSSWLVISGQTEQEVLEKEEELALEIPDNFLCTSMFIPSEKKQQKSISAVCAMDVQIVKEQFESFGFEDEEFFLYNDSLKNAHGNILKPADEVPESISKLLKMLWIGNVDGTYYSIILPVKITDALFYKQLAQKNDGVVFENKSGDISASLDYLTKLIFIMFAAAFAVVFIVLKFFYTWRETFNIASVPLLSVLSIVTVFLCAGLTIEFFCTTGMILVFGLGLDYIIYKTEHNQSRTESFAIFLSFLTTAVSFGSLALSSFVPVHVMGLSIFTGLLVSFLATVL